MSLKVKVNRVRENGTFHAGDQLSGFVLASGPINEEWTTVEIKFKGKSQTLIEKSQGNGTSSRWHSKIKFYSVTQALFAGPCKVLEGLSVSWPFTFELPLTTASYGGHLHAMYNRKAMAPFANEPHPLPPAMSTSGRSNSAKCTAFIAYSIDAQLHRHGMLTRRLHCSAALPVTECRPHSEGYAVDPPMTAYTRSFECATSRLLPDRASQSRSFREWMSDTFTSKAPRVCFTISARTPTTLIKDQVIPIEIGLAINQVEGTDSTTVPVPDFRLERVMYEMKQVTYIRADSSIQDKSCAFSNLVLHRDLSTSTSIKPNQFWTLRNLTLAGSNLVPSFNSYNICLGYRVKLTIKVACAGSSFAAVFRWPGVLLMPDEVEMPPSYADALPAYSKT